MVVIKEAKLVLRTGLLTKISNKSTTTSIQNVRFNVMINEIYYLPNVLSSTSFRCFSSLNAFNSSKLDFPLPFV